MSGRKPAFQCEPELGLPPKAALRQTLHQRLRLGDLRHFGRRREAFERRCEDRVGFGGACGRLIDLGEREGRKQFVAALVSRFGC